MRRITKENAELLIKSSNGLIFSIEFIKANGELRRMVCRTGVSKGITIRNEVEQPLARVIYWSGYDSLTASERKRLDRVYKQVEKARNALRRAQGLE